MKNIITAFAFSLLIVSCGEDSPLVTEMDPEVDPVVESTLDGTLQCLNNNTLEGVTISISDASGVTQSTTSDASGQFSFSNLAEEDYTLSFVDPTFYDYTQSEYSTIYQDLEDVILGVREGTNIDHIAYNFINYEDGLTTYDKLFIDRLKTGEILMSEIDLPWRYVFSSELTTNNTITNQLTFSYTRGLDLDITAIFVGDNSGIACP